ncbi:MAG: RDD family protein [Candidatus Acidiferrales bacterium]
MFCSGCGRAIPEGSAFCSLCGRPSVAAASPGAPVSVAAPPSYIPPAPVVPVASGLVYAGFWLRFVAYVIDSLILSVVVGLIILILIFTTGLAAFLRNLPENPNPGLFFQGTFFVALLLLCVGAFAGVWLYYACMESSRYQGTLGKMALGLIVTDMQCRPVSFARASGRFFAKLITGLIPFFIGYIMAGFTAKKQALHDMIASCLVLRKI